MERDGAVWVSLQLPSEVLVQLYSSVAKLRYVLLRGTRL